MYFDVNDTICAPATIPGTGAVSIVRISGPDSIRIADSLIRCKNTSLSALEAYKMQFAEMLEADGSMLDQVLVAVFRAPHSYTGEDSVEIYCHASAYIVNRCIQLLCDAGARAAEPGEFTRRAFANGKMDLAQAEAVADVIASQSASAHRVAMNQLRGGYSLELREMRKDLLELASLMELELDFSEEDVVFADRKKLRASCDALVDHIGRLIDSFKLGNALKDGIPTVIAGATNAGKSTLLNALLGEDRAIVSDIAGTTRDSIEASFNVDGVLFRVIDTAGLRESNDSIEKIGIERSLSMIEKADIVLAVFDYFGSLDTLSDSAALIRKKCGDHQPLIIPILNKIDLLEGDNKKVSPFNTNVIDFESYLLDALGIPESSFLRISATSGEGIPDLKKILSDFAHSSLNQNTTLVTNARHLQALKLANAALLRVRSALYSRTPADLYLQDLREALFHIGSITGEITTDEILGNIFARFCVGK